MCVWEEGSNRQGRLVHARPWAALHIAHWPERAAQGTEVKRRGDGSGLRQRVRELEASYLARFQVRTCSVGSGRRHRLSALQVFDARLVIERGQIWPGERRKCASACWVDLE
jgi:hypothetical protein